MKQDLHAHSNPIAMSATHAKKLDDNAVLFDDEDPVHSLVFLNCITTVSTNTDDNTPIIRVKYIEKSYKAAAIFLIILAVICIGILAVGAGSMDSAYILILSFLFLLFLVSTAAVIYTGRVSGFLRFYPDHLDFYYGARRNYRWRSIKRHISAYIELISYQVQRGQNHYITLYKNHINGQRVAKDLQEYDARFLHAYLIFFFPVSRMLYPAKTRKDLHFRTNAWSSSVNRSGRRDLLLYTASSGGIWSKICRF